ncbi:MAG: M28 family metallopeptidase [Oscillospiraceae bacterium]|nr:M28 family metallopeptidase [Oscillospiraceae bacterium]
MVRENVKALAKYIFEKVPARYVRREKDAFIERTKQSFREIGYTDEEMMIQQSRLGGRNLVVGPPDADILFTAHYDTPARNGWVMLLPLAKIVGMGIATLLSVPILVTLVNPRFALGLFGIDLIDHNIPEEAFILFFIAVCLLLFAIKNPHNHNDNSSGCIGVYNVATIVAENPDLRGKCAFVFFDMEEAGLFGSGAFAKWRRKHYPGKENSRVINLDCIADGDILVCASAAKSAAVTERAQMAEFLRTEGFETVQKTSNLLGYLSDHAKFPRGVGLMFLRRSRLGGLYIPNIHTGKDQVCDLDQIERLSESIVKYVSEA